MQAQPIFSLPGFLLFRGNIQTHRLDTTYNVHQTGQQRLDDILTHAPRIRQAAAYALEGKLMFKLSKTLMFPPVFGRGEIFPSRNLLLTMFF